MQWPDPKTLKLYRSHPSETLFITHKASKCQFVRDPFVDPTVKCVLINYGWAKERGNVADRNWNWNVLSQSATSCLASSFKKICLMHPDGQMVVISNTYICTFLLFFTVHLAWTVIGFMTNIILCIDAKYSKESCTAVMLLEDVLNWIISGQHAQWHAFTSLMGPRDA